MGSRAGQDGLENLNIPMRIKPTSAYENIRIYYTIIIVKLLHVSVTFCGNLQGGFYSKGILQRQKQKPNYKVICFKYVIHNVC
jgi:hypothetical protein